MSPFPKTSQNRRKALALAFLLSLAAPNILPIASLAQGYDDDDDDYQPRRRRQSTYDDGGNADNSGRSNDDNPSKPSNKLFIPAFVTYWSHDALGYHPSIAFTVENNTGKSLLGTPIQLQAHFRVLSEGILNVYNWQTYFDTSGGQQLVNTEAHGKRPFELPMDQSQWPLIECKILCKLPDGSPSQNLLVARVQPVAMTEDDARSQLNFLLGRTRLAKAKMEAQKKKDQEKQQQTAKANPSQTKATNPAATRSGAQTADSRPEAKAEPKPEPKAEPLMAVAGSLGSSLKPQEITSPFELLTRSSYAGLADDFYLFEKTIGMPVETDLKDKNWIWANYRRQPALRFYAGSKGRTGKADTVIAVLQQDNLSDSQVSQAIKALSGKFKGEKLNPIEHSVRYVDTSVSPSGRIEFMVANGQSFRGLCFKLRENDGSVSTVIVVSRLPGSLAEQLKEEAHNTNVLSFLLTGLGERGDRADRGNRSARPDDR
ncbi:MAG: hypothetical protein K2Y32_02315 [Candidatus Obscuribacterales bacterium]|nr:hypothetical protein [Candidatus Obscuribacterales bacterium]